VVKVEQQVSNIANAYRAGSDILFNCQFAIGAERSMRCSSIACCIWR